jgi:hypothetical protein
VTLGSEGTLAELRVTHGVALWPWEGPREGFGGLVWALGLYAVKTGGFGVGQCVIK